MLDPNIHFIGPLSVVDGKESVVEAAKNFAMFFKNLTISEKFSSNDKVMLVKIQGLSRTKPIKALSK